MTVTRGKIAAVIVRILYIETSSKLDCQLASLHPATHDRQPTAPAGRQAVCTNWPRDLGRAYTSTLARSTEGRQSHGSISTRHHDPRSEERRVGKECRSV